MTASGVQRPVLVQGPVLQMRGLTVALPGDGERACAVEDLDLDVARGEIVCLVGESGSGKSIACFAIMGLLPPNLRARGSIRVVGDEIIGADEGRLTALRGRRMAMVFQEPMTALNPVMRCGKQIAEAFRAPRERAPRGSLARVYALLAEVGIDDVERVARAYPHELSGGQRQRVVIAMALALEPDLLVADEPTTALDVTTQAQILDLVRAIARDRGTGILFVTHDFGVVEEIADRIIVLKGGRAVEQGSRLAVLRRPAHPYTRALIDAVPDLAPRPPRRGGGPPLLEVEGLGKTYRTLSLLGAGRSFRAVDDVSFTIAPGETMGLVGESGSGKSTVARCIARLIDLDEGAVRIDGSDIARLGSRALRPYRKRVQIVFQDPYRSLNPRRTIAEAMIEGPMNFGVPRAQAQAEAARLLDLVRIDPAALDRFPRQFSGGQRQRICVARALAMNPTLLIADEALSALDVSVQAEMLTLFEDLRARLALTILFITHDLRVAARLCDTVAVMRRGRIVETGAIAAVFTRPTHPYTAALLAAVPGLHASPSDERRYAGKI